MNIKLLTSEEWEKCLIHSEYEIKSFIITDLFLDEIRIIVCKMKDKYEFNFDGEFFDFYYYPDCGLYISHGESYLELILQFIETNFNEFQQL